MEDGKTVIDHFDNIIVSTEVHHNLLNVLQSLELGMVHLAEFVRRREVEALERYGNDRIVFYDDFGNGLELLLGCMFDWFSVSLVNYMRTIQLIQLRYLGLGGPKAKPSSTGTRACNLYIKTGCSRRSSMA